MWMDGWISADTLAAAAENLQVVALRTDVAWLQQGVLLHLPGIALALDPVINAEVLSAVGYHTLSCDLVASGGGCCQSVVG